MVSGERGDGAVGVHSTPTPELSSDSLETGASASMTAAEPKPSGQATQPPISHEASEDSEEAAHPVLVAAQGGQAGGSDAATPAPHASRPDADIANLDDAGGTGAAGSPWQFQGTCTDHMMEALAGAQAAASPALRATGPAAADDAPMSISSNMARAVVWEVPARDIMLGSLGEGSCGCKTYRATYHGTAVTVKVMPGSSQGRDSVLSSSAMEALKEVSACFFAWHGLFALACALGR